MSEQCSRFEGGKQNVVHGSLVRKSYKLRICKRKIEKENFPAVQHGHKCIPIIICITFKQDLAGTLDEAHRHERRSHRTSLYVSYSV